MNKGNNSFKRTVENIVYYTVHVISVNYGKLSVDEIFNIYIYILV